MNLIFHIRQQQPLLLEGRAACGVLWGRGGKTSLLPDYAAAETQHCVFSFGG